jgi:hypothetical protein
MNLKEFINKCNESPLFKKKNILITREVLKKYGFVKKKYELHNDLVKLSNLITAPQLGKLIEPPQLQTIAEKHLRHRQIIQHPDRQQEVIKAREALEMPNIISGFRIDRKSDISIINFATNPKKYELASSWLLQRSSKFKKWLFSVYAKYGIKEGKKRIQEIIYKVLEKWDLPKRYYPAIEELILFNRIIPAYMGLQYHYKRHPVLTDKFEKWVKIDKDLSIKEIMERLRRDKKSTFLKAHDKNLLFGRARRRKRSQIRKKILELYAKYKEEVNARNIPKKIRKDLWWQDISTDAIRKIIKRD